MSAAVTFLMKNPLASGLGILCLLLGIGIGVQTLRLSWADEALGTEKLAFSDFKKDLAEKSVKLLQEAALKSKEQVEALDRKLDNIGAVGAQVRTEVRYVQSNGGPCGADPAYLAGIDGVQRVHAARGSGGDKGGARVGPAEKVPGARAAVPR